MVVMNKARKILVMGWMEVFLVNDGFIMSWEKVNLG